MFEVGFSELLLIGAVALVVLGPERLPKVARTIGALVGRARRFAASVRADLDRELAQTELARIEAELRAEQEAVQQTMQPALDEARQTLTVDGPAVTEPEVAAAPLPEPAAAEVREPDEVVVSPQQRAFDERQLDLFAAAPPPAGGQAVRDRR